MENVPELKEVRKEVQVWVMIYECESSNSPLQIVTERAVDCYCSAEDGS